MKGWWKIAIVIGIVEGAISLAFYGKSEWLSLSAAVLVGYSIGRILWRTEIEEGR